MDINTERIYYVYRYKNSRNRIIYVGRTCSLYNRIKQHNEQWAKSNSVKIEFIKVNSKLEQDIYESYFINLYDCKYNTTKKNLGNLTFTLPDVVWEKFDRKVFNSYLSNVKMETKIPSDKQIRKNLLRRLLKKYLTELTSCFMLGYNDYMSIYSIKFNCKNEADDYCEALIYFSNIEIQTTSQFTTYISIIDGFAVNPDGLVNVKFNKMISNYAVRITIREYIKSLKRLNHQLK